MEATTVATALANEMFFRFPPPKVLHLDQDHQFDFRLLKNCAPSSRGKSIPHPITHKGMGWWSGLTAPYWTCWLQTVRPTLLIGSLMLSHSAMHTTQVCIRILLITLLQFGLSFVNTVSPDQYTWSTPEQTFIMLTG